MGEALWFSQFFPPVLVLYELVSFVVFYLLLILFREDRTYLECFVLCMVLVFSLKRIKLLLKDSSHWCCCTFLAMEKLGEHSWFPSAGT